MAILFCFVIFWNPEHTRVFKKYTFQHIAHFFRFLSVGHWINNAWHLQIGIEIITNGSCWKQCYSFIEYQCTVQKNEENNNNRDKLRKLRMQATVQTSVINHRLADTRDRDIPTVSSRGRYFVCSFIIIFW